MHVFIVQKRGFLLLLKDVAFGDVDTIQELTNILVADTAGLLNVGSYRERERDN